MPYNPTIHHRRSIRLKGYDYSQAGLYFITICVQDRKYLFGQIEDGVVVLNDAGKMAQNEWQKIPSRFTNVQLHEYIIMPNHFHAIMEIVGSTLVVDQNAHDDGDDIDDEKGGQSQGIAPTNTKTIGDIVGAFQSIVTVEYIRGVKRFGWQPFNAKLWQRNFYEHIIRDEQSCQRISNYIVNNPKNWKEDKFY